jgi:hypothetical protein
MITSSSELLFFLVHTLMETFKIMHVMRHEIQTKMQIKFPFFWDKTSLHCRIYIQT